MTKNGNLAVRSPFKIRTRVCKPTQRPLTNRGLCLKLFSMRQGIIIGVLCACFEWAFGAAGQIAVEGIQDQQTLVGPAAFRILAEPGFQDRARLNGV